MKIGLLYSSQKQNEKRYPLHWKHLIKLTPNLLKKIIFEEGYPGIENLNQNYVKTAKRQEIFKLVNLVVLPKPVKDDYHYFQTNQIVWGWPHAVQTPAIVDVAIEKKLTLIAWEHMYAWDQDVKGKHIFARNNEIAGYASVIHALTLAGITAGAYGNHKKIAVIGYGSTGKGAITALLGLGAEKVSVYSRRSKAQIAVNNPQLEFKKYQVNNSHVLMEGKNAFTELAEYDIIVNCILQNPLKPKMFMSTTQALSLQKPLLIIDVSCDAGMGFEFAQPTSFTQPQFHVGHVTYYGVDHSPSFFFEAASFEISKVLFPHLLFVLENNTYRGNSVLEKAIDIEQGQIINKEIISFQQRNV